ncbi:MAG: hypothetical protein ACFFHV_22645 [Promethearchaeota archaeon]
MDIEQANNMKKGFSDIKDLLNKKNSILEKKFKEMIKLLEEIHKETNSVGF